MEKTKVVIDASIVVKWFLEEEYSDKALKLRNDYVRGIISLAAPSLMIYEVLNALKYSGVYSREELKETGISLNKYGFELFDLEDDFKELTIEIAVDNNMTIYDASYIALARKLGTVLYTADKELLEKFPKETRHIVQYG